MYMKCKVKAFTLYSIGWHHEVEQISKTTNYHRHHLVPGGYIRMAI
jgi:hypothetical protein